MQDARHCGRVETNTELPSEEGCVCVFKGQRGQETSLAVQWLRLRHPMQGVQDRSLVGELRSHMPRSQNKQAEAIL